LGEFGFQDEPNAEIYEEREEEKGLVADTQQQIGNSQAKAYAQEPDRDLYTGQERHGDTPN
jgi:hypothetical protein